MGLLFFLKRVATVVIVAALIWLTWYKATGAVREVVEFQKKLDLAEMKYAQESQNKVNGSMRKETRLKIDTFEQVEMEDKVIKATNAAQLEVDDTDPMTTEGVSDDDFTTTTTTTTTTATTTTPPITTPTETDTIMTVLMSNTLSSMSTVKRSTSTSGSVEAITNVQELERQRTEKRHVAFLKVHKTGSSTVQNIFLRFGDSRNLTFILAHDDTDLAETNFPNVISYSRTLTEDNIVPPPEGRHYEILCCHVIYNRTQFQKYLPKDTAYIGLVREPVARLESSFRYFNLYPNITLSDFAVNPLHYDKGLHSMSNNRMSFEFGFPLNLFPNSKEKPDNLQLAITQYINTLNAEFDIIMINEKMDESLVLLKRILNWHFKDIMYMKQLVSKRETRRFSETDIKHLKSYLYLDYALYEAAVREFDSRIELLGEDFREEVNLFKENKEKVHSFCRNRDMEILSFPRSKWDSAYEVTLLDCNLFTKYEIKFVQDIRKRMYGKLGI